ncbi:HupE/UreJ family protein [Acuticoccus kandeliae]|uniref:HupE/UreJ family protein n=1 Tax=Acuticoccus kandeliae TaxID=2073160 RepID=UPI000D3E49FC|nr:HupE/UreJ family protein [Acuticoccus kandeliae]
MARPPRLPAPAVGCRAAAGRLLAAIALAWLLAATGAAAHEVRPAYLQIDETGPDTYEILWKVPIRNGAVADIVPVFDPGLALTLAGPGAERDGFFVQRYRLAGAGGLAGTEIAIPDLARTSVDALAALNLLDGTRHAFLLQPKSPSVRVPLSPSGWGVVTTYVQLGIEHILMGIDHLLFVLALILLTSGVWRLVKTITGFTLAHTITLSLAALGYVNVPGPPVEAAIALSIMFLAVEVVRKIEGEDTLTARKPWLVAFTFGLLHGLGFAGALSEIGLPQGDIPLALASFNIGVELGQLAFVAATLLIIQLFRAKRDWPLVLRKIPAYAIGSVAAFWVIERIAAFAA